MEKAKLEVEKAKLEAERAKAEVENAKIQVELAKAEVERARLEAQRAADAAAAAQRLLDEFKNSMAVETALWKNMMDEVRSAQASKAVIKTNKSKYTVKAGKTVKIKASSSDGSKLTFKSSDKKIAKVNTKGKITGVKKGKATITIKASGVKKKVKVTVK